MVLVPPREHSKEIYKMEWFVELLLDLWELSVNCKRHVNADGTYLSSAPLSTISKKRPPYWISVSDIFELFRQLNIHNLMSGFYEATNITLCGLLVWTKYKAAAVYDPNKSYR